MYLTRLVITFVPKTCSSIWGSYLLSLRGGPNKTVPVPCSLYSTIGSKWSKCRLQSCLCSHSLFPCIGADSDVKHKVLATLLQRAVVKLMDLATMPKPGFCNIAIKQCIKTQEFCNTALKQGSRILGFCNWLEAQQWNTKLLQHCRIEL